MSKSSLCRAIFAPIKVARPTILPHGLAWAIAAGAALGGGVGPAMAQSAVQPIGTIDGTRVDRQNPGLPGSTAPVATPQFQVSVDETPGASKAPVRLTKVRFEGSTLQPEALARSVASFNAVPLTRENLQKIANAVSNLYAKSRVAYFSVGIPAQSAAGGVLVVRVVEGRIAEYKIKGVSPSTPANLIDAQMQPLLHERPATRARIERTLSLMRDVPGQTIDANLVRTDKPDELQLDLGIKRKQVEITLNTNNLGIANVTNSIQAQLGVAINGGLREGDQTRFSGYLPIQPSRYQFYSVSHGTPIGANGTTLTFGGSYMRTRTSQLNIRGDAKQATVGISHPFIRSYKRNLTVSASIDGVDSQNYFLDLTFGGFKTRTARLGATWSVVDKENGYAISTSLSQGLSALGAAPLAGYSDGGFRKLNLQAVGVKQLSKALAVKLSAKAQYTANELPTTERFVVGGEGAGIAYRYGTFTGDKGVSGDAEVSVGVLGRGTAAYPVRVFAYVDAATTKSFARPVYALPSRTETLMSAGAGVRITAIKSWRLNAQVAVPVNGISTAPRASTQFFFNISRTL